MVTTVVFSFGITATVYHDSNLTVKKVELSAKKGKDSGSEILIGRFKRFESSGKIEGVEIEISKLTPFQQKVLEIVKNIPPGKTVTYKEVAKLINTHPRAVGQALKRNPFPLVIPCHRVVARDGKGGFSAGVKLKKILLHHEKSLLNHFSQAT
ncbi:methylated-DNA--[protein]-cysteine S-methyltransferase [Desulfurobacterium atlanticum]|uniref:methylated-DNA--[protein]-cysteine S-methyltransferase n=1 Tax=Desulfurobacterium atlanticum TaxID=240169 RepID=A0A238ZC77_9BACT|nr:MGMT family protein [Desulfurobacterium atlanticum]SNR80373.1 methylated-DNA-[protein]-cysteine S-methyltransferase [Desulfurobacterium atlanticum]